MDVHGRQMRTTMPWVFPRLIELFGPAFTQEHFVETYTTVNEEIMFERERDGIEITCHERFRRAIERMGLADDGNASRFAEELTRVHMSVVRSVTWAPEARIEAVRQIAPYYRLGLLSNFDDAQCGREVLGDTGVADRFEAIVISAEVGLRKPDIRIFEHMLAMLQVEPSAILFVGDTPRDDVLGASAAGMHTAWISKGAAAVPEGIPTPDFIIPDLSDLPKILKI